MADDLKFGPKWLHALTDGNSVTSPPPSPGFVPKYKLADHRYGREEMLALFPHKSTIPEELKSFPILCLDKVQHPLAFAPLSEEEQQLLTPGVNSLAVLRMMGRGASVPRGGGRGGGERGRGRGRGRGDGFYSSREYEDGGFGRGRTLRADSWDDRGGDKRFGGFSRGFPEENVISPRKEFSRSMSSENWREQPKQEQEQEDDGNWRRAGPKDKNLGTRVSWRERGSDKDYERPRFDERPYDRGGYGNRNRYKSTGDDEEDLPEWSMADTEDDIGTFDASGAFMSVKELEEKKHKVKDRGETVSKKKEPSSTEPSDNSDKKLKKVKVCSPENDAKREGEVPEKPKASKTVPKSNINKQDTQKEAAAASTNKVSEPSAGGGLVTPKSQGKPPPEGTVTRATKGKPGREDTHDSANSVVDTNSVVSQGGPQPMAGVVASSKAPPGKKDKVQSSATKQQTAREKQPPKDQKKRSPVPSLKADSETTVIKMESPRAVDDVPKTAINNTARTKGRESPPITTRKQEEEADFGHLEKAAENLVAEMTLEEDEDAEMESDLKRRENDLLTVGKPMVLAMDHEHAQKWFYRDPQGEVQGPFGAGEMSEWFSAGYFTMNLMVKRGCDENFRTLGDLIKKWGRVPFLPGNVPPPLRVSPVTIQPTQAPATVSSNIAVSSAAPPPQVATTTADSQLAAAQQAEQLKAFLFQQQYLQQQAVVFRQLQMQKFIQSLQQDEAWTKLPAQQQQQLALQLMLKQQQQQQQQTAVLQHSLGNAAATTASSTVVTQGEGQPTPTMLGVPQQQVVGSSQQQPQQQDLTAATQNTPKQLQGMPEKRNDPSASIWNALKNPPVSGSAWSQPASVWDIEQSGKAKSLEEIEREDFTRAQQEKERRDLEVRQKSENEERVRQQREVERLRQMEIQKEMERQREVDKQREMERHTELEKQRMEQLQREEADKRRQEEEQLRRAEEQLRRAEEQRRQVEEEKQKAMEAEKKRGEEMRRRQQKAEELRRQQQKEALFRLQQEQLANMQLPQHVQWASNNSGVSQNSTGLTLQQIQQLEAQQERQEMAEREKLQEQQRQQLEALQQQQDKASLSWAQRSQQAAAQQSQPMKSLLEIQQEQARQHLSDLKNKPPKQTTVPLATAAAWSGSGVNPANWAQEGAWGNNRNVAGFWEEPVRPKPTSAPTEKVNNAHFPALHQQPTVNSHTQNKQKQQAKTKKDEEAVQRLFQVVNPKDDFTQWCEMALSGMQSSVDIPTFVGFLIEVESPYEVHDYVRSYLGDSKDSIDFAKQFIEKRSQSRSQAKKQTHQKEEAMWGPAPAVNPSAMTNNNFELVTNGKGSNQKKKTKKMQRVDNSILGFTCSAATERVNIGEIENL